MRRLCLGGSFNPIHVGHLICARSAAEQGGFAGVRIIPTAANPHKGTAGLAAASDRLAMCQQAVAGDPFFLVDDRELGRPGPSFTFDTVAELLAGGDEPGPRVAWLVGTDLLARLHTWHRFDELRDLVDFVVMRRAGQEVDPATLDPRVAAIVKQIVVVPAVEISSTTIRDRVRTRQPIIHLVPAATERIVKDRRLYLE